MAEARNPRKPCARDWRRSNRGLRTSAIVATSSRRERRACTRGADRHDKGSGPQRAFWPEATVSYEKPLKLDEFVSWDESRLAGYAAHQHRITGQTIDIDGNTAHVESYVITFLVPRDRSADGAGPATPGRALTSEKSLIGKAAASSSDGRSATGNGRSSCASTLRISRSKARPSTTAAREPVSGRGTGTIRRTCGRSTR